MAPLVIAILAGIAVGLVLGALGGGGAIITVPILVFGLGMTFHQGSTGSLVIVGISSLIAALSHARAGRVAWAHALIFVGLGAVGTIAGSLISRDIDGRILQGAFGVLLIVVASLMLKKAFGKGGKAPAGDGIPSLKDARKVAITAASATGVGLLTGFFGVGGGFAIIPALTLIMGFPMPLAVGTSLVVIGLNSAIALSTKVAAGIDLDWAIIGAFTVAAILGSLGGARITGIVKPTTLQKAFGVLLLLVSAYTIVQTLLH